MKKFALKVWSIFLGIHSAIFLRVSRKNLLCGPRLFYGGARGGDVGGPLVKIAKLKKYFPQKAFSFNLVYILSNSIYLPKNTIEEIRSKSIPIVLNQNGVYFPAWYPGDYAAANSMMSYVHHNANYVFWQSKYCKRAAEKFLGARLGPGQILYNAVDINKFYPGDCIPSDSFVFLMTGKINRSSIYRFETAIRGLVYIRKSGFNAKICFAGWVQDIQLLNSIIQKYGVERYVDIFGPYTQDQAPQIYRQANAYLSTTYMDSCPSAVLEALASGLPIVHLDSGGTPELVGAFAGAGIAVPEDWESIHIPSEEAIGYAMIKVFEGAKDMSGEARARAEVHFNIEDWVLKHRDLFEFLINTKDLS